MKDQLPTDHAINAIQDDYPISTHKNDISLDSDYFDAEMIEIIDKLNDLQCELHLVGASEHIKAVVGEIVGHVVDIKNGLFVFFYESENSEKEK